METTKEKHATHTPGPWQISCIDETKDSLMVGGGDDGSDIVADIRTHENDILNTQAELYDDIPAMRSRAHVEGWSKDSLTDIDRNDKEAEKRLAELERKEKEAHTNARLIAAAPEMYEMCKLLEECMENLDGRDGWDASYELAKVREVLAKVEGGKG
jgi:hypothetical protein